LEPLLTSAEAASILRVNPKVLERWAKAGDVPALKVGKFWRYRASALESWVDTQIHSESQPCRIEPSF
jgi:excisionase family DNA binding protein